MLAYDFKTGKRIWETTIADPKRGEVGAVGTDCLGRPRLRRQCGRRLQGRQGAHVRARREDRQDRLGVLSGSQGRGRRGPRTARHRARSTRRPGKTRPAYRSAVAEPGPPTRSIRKPGCCTSPAAIRLPTSQSACARARISIPTRSSCSTPRPATTSTISRLCRRIGTTGTSPTRPILIQTMGGKQLMVVAPKDGYLYGFDLANNSALYKVPVTRVENVAETFRARQGRPFLPGRGGGRGMEQPVLRSADEPDPRRRSRVVRHGNAEGCR